MTVALTTIRQALEALALDRVRFHAIMSPTGKGLPRSEVDREVLATLHAAEVIELRGALVHPRVWVALRRDRPYFMSLQPATERDPYVQDLWPETDAVMEWVRWAPVGTLLDVGTGSGVIAIEAALTGHQVTATDLYESALVLAAFNAALHGVELELLQGDLYQPVAGRRFDHVVSAPHYTGPADHLRVETLRGALAHVAPRGAFYQATFLESGEGREPYIVEHVLRPLVAEGAAVKVRALTSELKKRWFTAPVPFVRGLDARHRYGMEVRPGGPPGLDFEPPSPGQLEPQAVVPLSRLTGPRATRPEVRARLDGRTSGDWNRNVLAVVDDADDVAAMEHLLAQCARGVIEWDQPVPFRLLDACRFGAQSCDKAHGAIVGAGGVVRPCTLGEPIGSVGDRGSELHARLVALREDAAVRRGCATCAAVEQCPLCLYPGALEEAAYCDLIRRHAGQLRIAQRVIALLHRHHFATVRGQKLTVKVRPGGRLVAARLRPYVPPAMALPDPELRELTRLYKATGTMLVIADGDCTVEVPTETVMYAMPLTHAAASVVELATEGIPRPQIYDYAIREGIELDGIDETFAALKKWLVE